jgi:hypothetical protein
MRIALWLAAAGTAVALAGCSGVGHDTGDAITVAHLSQSPAQLAESDAASMLAAFVPPPGAVRSAPIMVLPSPPELPATPDGVLRTGWWYVAGQPSAELAWVRAHRPSGFSLGAWGGGSAEEFVEFSLPPVPGVLTQRSLIVSVAGDGPGRTAIRADAEVDWEPAKPAGERIPVTAEVVTISQVPGISMLTGKPAAASSRPVTVTDPAKVARIAAVVDGLPLFPPGTWSCPSDTGKGIKLTFRAWVRGPVLAVVTGDDAGCGGVSVTVGRRSMPALWHGAQLQQQVLAIAGIRWRGY